MSVKKEHPLNVNDDVKLKIEINDNDEADINDEKVEIIKSVNTEPEVVEERPIFICTNCNLTERYDYFNNHVPFNRNVKTKVNYYLARDPFSSRSKRQFLILGSVCSICNKNVCVKPECSIFYSRCFCSICARINIANFPLCIQEKIKTTNRI